MKPAGQAPADATALDVARIRRDFPILARQVHGKPLVYLDNAASTHKPNRVIEAVSDFYLNHNANVHRGLHQLSTEATQSFEAARGKVQRFMGAADAREIIFTRGTTEAINLAAHTFGESRVGAGDEIVLTQMEHHSNIVPWQLLCERKGAVLRVVPIDDAGDLVLDELESLLGPRTRLLALVHTSNAIGTRNPVEQIIAMAHDRDIPVLLDAAQAVAHEPLDVQALDCDLLAFSGHKLFGPTGIGVLYGKADLLEPLPPFQGGGEMIHSVTFEKTSFKGLPHRFEAGTPDIAGAIGLGAAIDYVTAIGLAAIQSRDEQLLEYATRRLAANPRVRLVGTAKHKAAIVSFVVDGIHPHDVGTVLDTEGVAVRAGHHCAQPLMERYGLPATVRASMTLFNTEDEIDALAAGIDKAIEILG